MEVVELYAKQFDWTARYPGKDSMLGCHGLPPDQRHQSVGRGDP